MDYFIQNLIEKKTKILINLHSLSFDNKEYWEELSHEFFNPDKSYTIHFSLIVTPISFVIERNIEIEFQIEKFHGAESDYLYHNYFSKRNIKKIKLITLYDDTLDFNNLFSFHISDAYSNFTDGFINKVCQKIPDNLEVFSYNIKDFDKYALNNNDDFDAYIETKIITEDMEFKKRLHILDNYGIYEDIKNFIELIEENKNDKIFIEYIEDKLSNVLSK